MNLLALFVWTFSTALDAICLGAIVLFVVEYFVVAALKDLCRFLFKKRDPKPTQGGTP